VEVLLVNVTNKEGYSIEQNQMYIPCILLNTVTGANTSIYDTLYEQSSLNLETIYIYQLIAFVLLIV